MKLKNTRAKGRKNVTLIEVRDSGLKSWELIDQAGNQILGFRLYMQKEIKKGKSLNTRKAYARAMSQFFDYLYEVNILTGGLTEELLEDACDCYESFMLFGKNSTDSLAKEVSKRLVSPLIKPTAYTVHHAALQSFLGFSSKFAKHIKALAEEDFHFQQSNQSENIMFESKQVKATFHQNKGIINNSTLAATICGGANYIKSSILTRKYPPRNTIPEFYDEGTDEKTFPWGRFQELLDAAPNHRARALWALIAAIGCRFSEAITVLNRDICPKKREVKIVAASERTECYPYLTESQFEILSQKGRQSRKTFMIYWGKAFFDSLLAYRISDEYVVGLEHDFLFQSMHSNSKGQPQVFHSYQSCLETFKATVVKVLGKGATNFGFHSLRHMYGIYLKNFAPRSDGGFGFSLSDVQSYMGHAHIGSTKVYALDSKEKLEEQMVYANAVMSELGGAEAVLKLKLDRNRKEYVRLMSETQAFNDSLQLEGDK